MLIGKVAIRIRRIIIFYRLSLNDPILNKKQLFVESSCSFKLAIHC